jgi:peptidoglycan/LPS O-acetylase OafA/YrhL
VTTTPQQSTHDHALPAEAPVPARAEVTHPTSGHLRRFGHNPALDGLRAVAVLLVIFYHALPDVVLGGWAGVDLFFVLSGFLITTLLLVEFERRNTISIPRFLGRRVARLMPASLVLLFGYFLLALATKHGTERHDTLVTLFDAATYRANLVANPDATHGLGHMWSLSFEEQFYLIWPALLLLMLTVRIRPSVRIGLTIAGIIACALWRAHLWEGGAGINRVYYWPDTRVDSLLMGCLAAQIFVLGAFGKFKIWRFMTPVALAGVVLFGFTVRLTSGWIYLGGLTLLAFAAALALVGTVTDPPEWLRRPLSSRPAQKIGLLSYSLYLWHLPILLFLSDQAHLGLAATAIIGIPLSFVAAELSYRFVERPFLRLKARLSADRRADGLPGPQDLRDADS